MNKYFIGVIILSIMVVFSATFINAQTNERLNTVNVGGEGIVLVEPDRVTVRFGVVTRDDDPVKARQLNEEAAADALNAVRDLDVEERKIKVTVLQLNEMREYDRERRRQVPAGFQATRQVVVELDDLDKLPPLIARVTQHGANRLSGLSYDISNRNEVTNDALRKAVLNAKEKAMILTETLDVSLGKVIHISEEQFDFPRPMPVRAMVMDAPEAAPDMGTPEAYAAGEIEVKARVQVTFALE